MTPDEIRSMVDDLIPDTSDGEMEAWDRYTAKEKLIALLARIPDGEDQK